MEKDFLKRKMKMIEIIERGWAGHYIGARSCLFRRNTLMEDKEKGVAVVISTVGNMPDKETGKPMMLGLGRHYETMVFVASQQGSYMDADVKYELPYFSGLEITEDNINEVDNLANEMHQKVLGEISLAFIDDSISLIVKEIVGARNTFEKEYLSQIDSQKS
jgi:hypothetical protein